MNNSNTHLPLNIFIMAKYSMLFSIKANLNLYLPKNYNFIYHFYH
jgi:hypothetical protein